MSLLNHSARRFDYRSRVPIAALVKASAITVLLATLTAAGVHAQGAGATSSPSNAGAQSWVHESWTVKDGLPVNSINAIIQDRSGYIWLATFDGLVRFDGVRFTVFNSSNSLGLPSDRILRMKQGHDGSLWLTTEQGHVVRFRDGRFTNIAFANAKPDERHATLFVDSAGVVWVGTAKGLWTVRGDSLVPVARTTLDCDCHVHHTAARRKSLGRYPSRGDFSDQR